MKKKQVSQMFPKIVNGQLIRFPPELGENFGHILQDIASRMGKEIEKVSQKQLSYESKVLEI